MKKLLITVAAVFGFVASFAVVYVVMLACFGDGPLGKTWLAPQPVLAAHDLPLDIPLPPPTDDPRGQYRHKITRGGSAFPISPPPPPPPLRMKAVRAVQEKSVSSRLDIIEENLEVIDLRVLRLERHSLKLEKQLDELIRLLEAKGLLK